MEDDRPDPGLQLPLPQLMRRQAVAHQQLCLRVALDWDGVDRLDEGSEVQARGAGSRLSGVFLEGGCCHAHKVAWVLVVRYALRLMGEASDQERERERIWVQHWRCEMEELVEAVGVAVVIIGAPHRGSVASGSSLEAETDAGRACSGVAPDTLIAPYAGSIASVLAAGGSHHAGRRGLVAVVGVVGAGFPPNHDSSRAQGLVDLQVLGLLIQARALAQAHPTGGLVEPQHRQLGNAVDARPAVRVRYVDWAFL